MQLYTGLGAGFSVPHVEVVVSGVKTYEKQAGVGPVMNGLMAPIMTYMNLCPVLSKIS